MKTKTGSVAGFKRDKNGWARVLVRFNEEDDPAYFEFYEPIGFTSSVVDFSNAEAVVQSTGQGFDSGVCTTVNYRGKSVPDTSQGESAIYWTQNPQNFIRIGENADYSAAMHSFISQKGYSFKRGSDELLTVIQQIIEAIQTDSKAGNVPVTNVKLPPLLAKLKGFIA